MSDPSTTPATVDTDTSTAPVADEVTTRLTALGVPAEMIGKIKDDLGAETVADLASLKESDLTGIGMKTLKVRTVLAALVPAAPVAATAAAVDPTAEIPEGATPSGAQMNGFADMLGGNPMMMMMLMNGQGGDMGLADLVPIPSLVAGYNPKRRDLYLTMMGQVEQRLGGIPIVVIDGDGSINRPLTVEYIQGMEEGREPAENDIYDDADGSPHQVIRVGVDAQSIYDADPLDPTRALQKNGMGIGRVNWSKVSLEAKQVAYFAVMRTKEIDPKSDAHQSWLRDHMKEGVGRLAFRGQAPRAIAEYNEASRTGSLPTLRVMLSRGPRRPEIAPRRRSTVPRNLTGIGGDGNGGSNPSY